MQYWSQLIIILLIIGLFSIHLFQLQTKALAGRSIFRLRPIFQVLLIFIIKFQPCSLVFAFFSSSIVYIYSSFLFQASYLLFPFISFCPIQASYLLSPLLCTQIFGQLGIEGGTWSSKRVYPAGLKWFGFLNLEHQWDLKLQICVS